MRLAVVGRETAWVRSVSARSPEHVFVEISLDQLTLFGPLDAVRERVRALHELLDDVDTQRDRWSDIAMTRTGPRT